MKQKSLIDKVMGPFDMMAGLMLFALACWIFTPPKKKV
jgi:hypothetical protein